MKKLITIILSILLVMSIILPATAFSSIAVKGIKLDTSTVSIKVGATYNIKVTFTPANTTQRLLAYATGNKNVASIDANGKITGVGIGTTTITVISQSNKAILAKCNVTILKNGMYPLVTKKTTISVMKIAQGPDEKLDTNPVTKFYENKTNVHVKWTTVPGDQFKEKANILLAGGEPIDVMFFANWTTARYSINEQYSMGKGGLVTPVGDYLDQAPNMKKALKQNPAMALSATCPDGKIYFVPNYNFSYHSYLNPKMFINKVWLDKLKLKTPQTTEDFYNVLKAFKNYDPNGNRTTDEIPLVSFDKAGCRADGFLLNAFIYNDSRYNTWLYLDKGKVNIAVNKPEFKEYLKYMNRLFNAGLYYKESFTLDLPGGVKLNEAKKEPVIGAAAADHMWFFSSPGEDAKWLQYTELSPLRSEFGPAVNHWRGYYDGGFAGGLIPASCKDPKLVMQWMDYLFTQEGSLTVTYGLENQGWRKALPNEKDRDGKPAKIAKLTPAKGDPLYGNVSWGAVVPCVNKQDFGWVEPSDMLAKDGSGSEKALYVWSKTLLRPFSVSKDKVMPPVTPSPENAQTVSQMKTTIETFVKEWEARFITGDLDTQKDWNNYLNELNKIGLDKYLSLTQEAYDKSPYIIK